MRDAHRLQQVREAVGLAQRYDGIRLGVDDEHGRHACHDRGEVLRDPAGVRHDRPDPRILGRLRQRDEGKAEMAAAWATRKERFSLPRTRRRVSMANKMLRKITIKEVVTPAGVHLGRAPVL